MAKPLSVLVLCIFFLLYSLLVYTKGTEYPVKTNARDLSKVQAGKQLYQDLNCQSCHQIYGLGGFLGPDLTTAASDPKRGTAFMRALLHSGGSRMPNFHLTETQIDQLLYYLKYVDATAHTTEAGYRSTPY